MLIHFIVSRSTILSCLVQCLPVDQISCSRLPDICKDDMVVRMLTEKGQTMRQVQGVSTLILAIFSFSRIQYHYALKLVLVWFPLRH